MVLAGLGVAGLAFGLSVAGLDMLPWPVIAALVVGGAVAMTAYLVHAKRVPAPILDFSLLRVPTFRASLVGGYLFRLGIGALPFLLPLMLQTGFGMTPFQSGLVTFAGAARRHRHEDGGLAHDLSASASGNVLLVNAFVSSAFIAACAIFTPGMPVAVLIAILLVGGFFRALEFTAINAIAYADIDQPPHEPRDRAGLGRTAIVDLDRGRGRRADGGMVAALARIDNNQRRRFHAAFLVVAVISGSSAFCSGDCPPMPARKCQDICRRPRPRRSRSRPARPPIRGWDDGLAEAGEAITEIVIAYTTV